jgi:hypothetical protein
MSFFKQNRAARQNYGTLSDSEKTSTPLPQTHLRQSHDGVQLDEAPVPRGPIAFFRRQLASLGKKPEPLLQDASKSDESPRRRNIATSPMPSVTELLLENSALRQHASELEEQLEEEIRLRRKKIDIELRRELNREIDRALRKKVDKAREKAQTHGTGVHVHISK